MASPQKYTTMPWVDHYALPEHIHQNSSERSIASDFGGSNEDSRVCNMKNAQNHEVLIRQIQESNKAYLEMSKKVTELEKDLSQRRKCDAAAQAFFVATYGKQDSAERQEKNNSRLSKNLEDWYCELRAEDKKLDQRKQEQIDTAIFEARVEARQKLDKKQEELRVRELILEQKEQALQKREEELLAQHEPQSATPSVNRYDCTTRDSITFDPESDRITYIFSVGGPDDFFKMKDPSKLTEHNFNTSREFLQGSDLELLRRQDYYGGWYDCMSMNARIKVAEGEEKVLLSDANNHRTPKNAGLNAGVQFAWDGLCKLHMPKWNIRLDERIWDYYELVPEHVDLKDEFWAAFQQGCSDACENFNVYLGYLEDEGDDDERKGDAHLRFLEQWRSRSCYGTW